MKRLNLVAILFLASLGLTISHAQEIVPLDVEPEPMQEAEPLEPAPAATEESSAGTVESEPAAPVITEAPVVEGDMGYQDHDFYGNWIQDKLEIGTRAMVSRSFDNTAKGNRTETFSDNYFGSIAELEPNDDAAPTRLYIQYAVHEYFGFGLTLDWFDLATRDQPNPIGGSPGPGDGDVEVSSTFWYLFARYPNAYNVIPFAELGYGFHSVDFSASADWYARGNRLDLDDDSGVYYAIGVEYLVTPNWSVNALYRVVSVSTSGAYTNVRDTRNVPVSMNLDHSVFGLGVKYTF